jgi:hypothetical protein
MPIYYSDFNDPSELANYNYTDNSYTSAQITNGYLEVYLGLYGKTTVYVMSNIVTYKTAIQGMNVKIVARISAYSSNNNMSTYAGVIDGIIVVSASDSSKNVRFGFSTPYLLAVDVESSGSANRPYQSGSWGGSDTDWHILEMDLYSDHIDFYYDGQLVYTLNNNPLANDRIYFGIIGSAGVGGASGYARADWLEVDPIGTMFDTTAYPSLTTQQAYVYTPADTTAYPGLTTQQAYISPPTPAPVTPLPSASQYYLLVFILFFLMLLALSRRRS